MTITFFAGDLSNISSYPTSRGKTVINGLGIASKQSLPTDAIGVTNVTFAGVPSGSEIRVQYPDLTDAAGIESCSADQILSWDVFAPGSPNNTVRVVIIDMTHRIQEFYYTSALGNQSIPVQAENDKWYSNP